MVETPDATILQGWVLGATLAAARVYTDEASAYRGLARRHETVPHSAGEYMREKAHTDGIESCCARHGRCIVSHLYQARPKHLYWNVAELAGRHIQCTQETYMNAAASR